MASCNLRHFGSCLGQFRENQLSSRNLTDFVNYNKPFKNTFFLQPLTGVPTAQRDAVSVKKVFRKGE